MPRRVSMPGADELFRSTAKTGPDDPDEHEPAPDKAAPDEPAAASGRIKHDEKMTVYITEAELLAVETARLGLRSVVGRKVDRGRLVRAALSLALDDFDANGADSEIVRRLRRGTRERRR